MPGGDRTGPMGAGPRTGRAAGFCAGYDMPGYMNQYGWCGGGWGRGREGGRGGGRGRGWGRTRGRGMGWRGGWGAWDEPYPAAPPPVDELEMLNQQYQHLEATLKGIKERMDQLEKEGD